MRTAVFGVALAPIVGCSLLVDSAGLSGAGGKDAGDGGMTTSLPDAGGGGTTEAGAVDAGPILLPAPTAWKKAVDAPDGRHSARAVYDSKREVVVVYGGNSTEALEWSGSAWQTRTYDAAPRRQGFGFAWDSRRNVAVLFGGQGGAAEVWELDGTRWTLRASDGLPTRLAGFNAGYDSVRGTFIGFGGHDDQGPVSDAWAWDGATMKKLPLPTTPSTRRGHATVFDGARGQMVVFGGRLPSSNATDETWLFDGSTWTQAPAPQRPPRRAGACMAYDSDRRLLVLFGGRDHGAPLADTWLWNGTTWTRGPDGPPARRSCAMAYDQKRKQTVLFGGTPDDDRDRAHRDTWLLD